MSMDIDNIQIMNLIKNSRWDKSCLDTIFSPCFSSPLFEKGFIVQTMLMVGSGFLLQTTVNSPLPFTNSLFGETWLHFLGNVGK